MRKYICFVFKMMLGIFLMFFVLVILIMIVDSISSTNTTFPIQQANEYIDIEGRNENKIYQSFDDVSINLTKNNYDDLINQIQNLQIGFSYSDAYCLDETLSMYRQTMVSKKKIPIY